ncbi:unnamed protein product [Mytilus edulis]|uniref:Uncharacterized protein n=1 Tax=Mytilus edulis TaxID=6550 RepID=A0A8S3S772_MYTED|nr:unnamed protein product [Mytilus edulis]
MADDYYDFTLFLIDKSCCTKCGKYGMTRLFVRILLNFCIDLAEFLVLEFDSGKPVGNILKARYAVIGFLAMHFICSAILLHHLIKVRRGDGELKKKARLKAFLFFKLLCFIVDGSILSYTIFIFEDFEVAIPFLRKPDVDINWRTWSLSLVCFLDMLLEISEILLITIALLCPQKDGAIRPSNSREPSTITNETQLTNTKNPPTVNE